MKLAYPRNFAVFKTSAHSFANELRKNFASGIPAQAEDQLKQHVQTLIQDVMEGVITRTEAQVYDLAGRPDIGVSVHGALCGYVELKAPGSGAQTSRFKGHDKKQWEKFKALPNLLYTDSIEWALYRSGVAQPKDRPIVIRFDDLIERGATALDDLRLGQLHSMIVDFLSWSPIVPSEPKQLAEMLAPLCRMLRTDVLTAVERKESALHRLCVEMRDYLFPHASNAEFADIYAQTLTYALLLARLSGETDLTTAHAADRLDSGHGLLAQTLRILTQSAARAEIETPVSLLERVVAAVNPEQLTRRGDPWLYFYEDFLAAYDPKLRKNFGVYYTPQQVIQCQVHLVSELLENGFNKPLTFADEGVVFLDSSAGTAAYPIAAIESALRRVENYYGGGAVAASATRCAQNVYGFELLVGPYAVAHLRLTKMLLDAGAAMPADGIHMYLTDTLESPHTDPPQPPLMADRLTVEQKRARRIKDEVPVFVCMGNPPYFREEGEEDEEKTRGKWVRFGDENVPNERPIFKDFTEPAGMHAKNLYNLYVYFWRWTLWKMFENPQADRRGIVCFITASSFLRGPGFIGMRQKMREAFDDIWIIDLEGGSLGARKTENVFKIKTPVCITLGVRYERHKRSELAISHYSRLMGTREEKYAQLAQIRRFADLQWRKCSGGAQEVLWPTPPVSWTRSPLVTDLWPWQHSGVQWKRNWPIGETREVLKERWDHFLSAPSVERAALFKETRDRKVKEQYFPMIGNGSRLPALSNLKKDTPLPAMERFSYRPLDRRWILYDNRLGDYLRPSLWSAHSEHQVYLTSLLTDVLGQGPAAVASAYVTDLHHFRGSFGGKSVIPLWRDAAASKPNLPSMLLNMLSVSLGAVTAEDFFAYTYAILAAPSYVRTFWEELLVPGPRLPITCNAALFQRGVTAGRSLLWVHTYGERFVPNGQKRGRIPGGTARCVRGIPTTYEGYPENVFWGEDSLRVGGGEFYPVPTAIWDFSVSGFCVVESWVKSRLRERTGRSSSSLDKIRPVAWTDEMTRELLELLWILEETVAVQPELDSILADILASPLFAASSLPSPTPAERHSPLDEPEEVYQAELEIEVF